MDVLTLTLNPCVDRTLWPDGRVDWQSGGKGVNVARVLANLGADCLALAPVGGAGGQTFAALARQEGVRLEEAPIQAQNPHRGHLCLRVGLCPTGGGGAAAPDDA